MHPNDPDNCWAPGEEDLAIADNHISRLEAEIEAMTQFWGNPGHERNRMLTEIKTMKNLLHSVLLAAERTCPCENEEPNPCPKCGASIENLEPCRAGNLTLPTKLYDEIRVLVRDWKDNPHAK